MAGVTRAPGGARKSGVKRTNTGEDASENEGEVTSAVQVVTPEVQAVRKVFTEAQRTVQCHQRCCDALRRLLSRHESAWTEYFACLSHILVVFKRDPGVERLVQFVSIAAASSVGGAADGALLARTVEFLLQRSTAADKAVRFRCCQLVGSTWAEMRDDQEIPSELVDRVVETMLPRLKDKVAAVRVQAVDAVGRLQLDPSEEEDSEEGDQVTDELIRMMMSDSSPDARQAALAAVNKTAAMLDQVVLRTQDVKESVRKAAFRTLGEQVKAKHLQPRQRVALLKRGLSDGSAAVVDACRLMLCTQWLRDVEYDPVQLLGHLDVVNNEELAGTVVKEIVRLGLKADRERGDPSLGMGLTMADAKGLRRAAARHVDVTSVPLTTVSAAWPAGDAAEAATPGGGGMGLSPEEALFARVQAEVIKDDKEMPADERETRLETILPDTTSLCAQIEHLSEALSVALAETEEGFPVYTDGPVFVLQQLLKLAAHADFSEETGRRRLVNLLQAILVDPNTHCDLVAVSMLALASAHPSEADLVRLVAELVSDISDHLKIGDTSVQNVALDGSLNASFASLPGGNATPRGGGGLGLGTGSAVRGSRRASLEQSAISYRTTIRAAIPKNFVKDRARLFEGGGGGGNTAAAAGSGRQEVPSDAAGSDDELFVDALSHLESDNEGENENDTTKMTNKEDVRSIATGLGRGVIGQEEEEEEEAKAAERAEILTLNRMFRILDMLCALFTKTRQTLARDPTLAGFGDIVIEAFQWYRTTGSPNVGVELRQLAVQCLGKYSLLGETAAVSHRPRLLEIAKCEQESPVVRAWAMQAISDLSLIYGNAIVGSTGDVMALFAGILRTRDQTQGSDEVVHPKGLVAVAAEAAARLLFFKLAHDPEVLARLFVLYFEKGSAADPAAAATVVGEDWEEVVVEDESAKEVGSSVRLSQILGVYFTSIPAGGPRARDMLSESVRHVLQILREIARLNVATKKAKQELEETEGRKTTHDLQLIDVPVQHIIRFVLDLLMRAEATATAAAVAVAAASSAAAGGAIAACRQNPVDPISSDKWGENEGEVGEEDEKEVGDDGTVETDLSSSSSDAAAEKRSDITENRKTNESSAAGDVIAADASREDATGYVVVCVADELFTCTGIDELADTHVPCLAKVLASLPLPENDQAAVKRLRRSVDRLLKLGKGQLDAKVSRVVKKYAKVLFDADLTPYEGVEDDDASSGGREEDGANIHQERSAASSSNGGAEDEERREGADAFHGESKTARSSRTWSTSRTSSSPSASSKRGVTAVPPDESATFGSARPSRPSKTAKKARMSRTASLEAAPDAAERASLSSDSDTDECVDVDVAVSVDGVRTTGKGRGDEQGRWVRNEEEGASDVDKDHDHDEDDSDGDASSECSKYSTATVETRPPAGTARRASSCSSPRLRGEPPVPLGEISNTSPVPANKKE